MKGLQENLRYAALAVAAVVLPVAVASGENPKGLEVTIGDRVTPSVVPGPTVPLSATTGVEILATTQFFELSPYRAAKVKWADDLRVEVRLHGEMKPARSRSDQSLTAIPTNPDGFRLVDCGLIPATEDAWTFDPSDLFCKGKFVDGASIIEVRVKGAAPSDDRAIYFRSKNRRFPYVGSDLGIALTLTQPLRAEGDLDKGFEMNDGLSFYYAVSRLKSDRWRLVTSLAALDHVRAEAGETEDPEDFEIGLGIGAIFKSNGFLDTNTGMSLAAGIGYNFMVPDSSERWYWFFGVGANFGKATGGSK